MIVRRNPFTGQKARAFLSQRGVYVVGYEPFPGGDQAKINIACAITQEILLRLLKNIVRAQQKYCDNKVPLPQPVDQSSLNCVKEFLDKLVDYGLAPKYRINHRTNTLIFTKRLTDEQYNYLTGSWLEYYVASKILSELYVLAKSGVECDFLFRAKYGSRWQIQGEIDCLALIDTKPIVVEAKSCHDFYKIDNKCISKFADLARRIGAPMECAIIVSLAAENKGKGVTIIPFTHFPAYFDRISQCVWT